MLFSSTNFLYWFLPITIVLYFATWRRGKNFVLLLCSLFFYYYGEPKYIVVMLSTILVTYIMGFFIDKAKRPKIPLAISIILSLSSLLYFKYTDFFISNTNNLFGTEFSTLKLILPIGISFYTFQAISYSIDLYRGDAKLQRNLINFACYISLFPQLIAGPIVRYSLVEEQLQTRTHSLEKISEGAMRFTIGMGKKVLIANVLGEFCTKYTSSNEQSVLFAWMWAIAFSLQIYFDFSGYSDMAVGLGKIFGFDFPDNFNYPFISQSITEFWRRWHMSLGSWFRDYVYIPMGGNRVGAFKWVVNIAVVWFLTGFWHGASWNFILWGLFFAVFLSLEKVLLQKFLNKLPRVLRHIYLLFFIVVSFMIFASETMPIFTENLQNLTGAVPLVTRETLYYLQSYATVFLIAFIGATPLPKMLSNKLFLTKGGATAKDILSPIFMVALLVLCTAFLVEGSFNPFLYFRF